MSANAITTAIITVASVLAATMLASSVIPVLFQTSQSVVGTAEIQGNEMQTAIDIIANSNDLTYHYIWIKNTGLTEIPIVEESVIFFGPVGNFRILLYSQIATDGTWNYTIENDCGDARWDPRETIKITVNPVDPISSGDFYFQIVSIHAIEDSIVFSI